jgi:fimbrial chaperone protein
MGAGSSARLWRLRAAGLAFFLLLVALPAAAATFKVSPIQIYLSTGKTTELLAVENQSSETVRLQVTAFGWNQSPRGEIELAPTEDVVFFPALLTLEPGKERKIRIGVSKPAGAVERTYRVFVEELPPLEKPSEVGNRSEVKVLTRFGVPIFVQPAKLSRSGAIENSKLESGTVKFQVKNTGNAAFSLVSVRTSGAGADGSRTFENQAAGWYVLAGGERVYEIAVSAADCQRTKTISIEAKTERDTWKASLTVAAEACGPAPQ